MNPPPFPDNHIDGIPDDILTKFFEMLPSSHRFVSPVCRRFRDIYGATVKKKHQNKTYRFSLESADALLTKLLEDYCVGSSLNEKVSIIGARCGRIDWMERGGVFGVFTCSAAARGGQLHALKWLQNQEGFNWNSEMCYSAAEGGHLEVLRWLRREGCNCSSATCRGAAEGGQLEVLQWLSEWAELSIGAGADLCSAAVRGKHLEVLRWAIENGCSYNEPTFNSISDPEFLEWFENHKASETLQ